MMIEDQQDADFWLKDFFQQVNKEKEEEEEQRRTDEEQRVPVSALRGNAAITIDKTKHPVSQTTIFPGTVLICSTPLGNSDPFWIGIVTKVPKNFTSLLDGELKVDWMTFKSKFLFFF